MAVRLARRSQVAVAVSVTEMQPGVVADAATVTEMQTRIVAGIAIAIADADLEPRVTTRVAVTKADA
jgi:hypothetical protein